MMILTAGRSVVHEAEGIMVSGVRLSTWLKRAAALVLASLMMVGIVAGPAHADDRRWPSVKVVDEAGKPVRGVWVEMTENDVTYPDGDWSDCGGRWCVNASGHTDKDGLVYSPRGAMRANERYSLELSYWNLPYSSDHVKGHPEWGSSPYSSVTTSKTGSPIVVVLERPKVFGTIKDDRGAAVTATLRAYEVTASGGRGKLAETSVVYGYGMDYWDSANRYALSSLKTGKKYKLAVSDVVTDDGTELRDQWIGGNNFAGASTVTVTGKAVSLVVARKPLSLKATQKPVVSGTARVGERLSVSEGTWNHTPSSVTFQWLRDGRTIKGATRSTHSPSPKDVGKKLAVNVVAKRSGFPTVKIKVASSSKVALGKQTVKRKPSISGTQLAGRKLTVSKGSWLAKPSRYSYQWYRSGKAIKKATASTYKVQASDRGKKISAKVWAKRDGYRSASSATASKYIYRSGLKLGKVTVAGSRSVGKTLTAKVSRSGGTTVRYQWYRNGSAIKGATKARYKLRWDDWIEKVSVKVTISKPGLPSVSTRSAKVYIPNNPDYDDDYWWDESDGSDDYNGPRCYAPGGKTWEPC